MRHQCPHCQLPHAVSFARKSVPGFASSALCPHCSLKITVHNGYALLAMLPPLLPVAAIFLRMVREPRGCHCPCASRRTSRKYRGRGWAKKRRCG